ncbi:DUF3558 domain-containing protein [Actinokineospora globicatena]|uniref:DUF3558 domain-containing protein n=1 Tax=Actinokineospora globicatena TaxID=103729 RepID=UPI0020A2D25B|nr:DUF3558 domain-containing protein [Actinokineospora globicatena]MCP2300872.1 Protein of unknown function (DUF3558) [Actinokineospora globicatena]GLW77503.1 hypothetical protein Aglo01_19850 [Actinokineospora globicatena]GLW84337.1 hypothetical protein Aglo02_19770 [Actinokineospora globicatena]
MGMRPLICLVALAALVSACAESGTPVPGTSTAAPTPTTGKYGAPGVQDPVEPGGFLKDPCEVLTRSQAGELGWEAEGTPHDLSSNDPYCSWSDKKNLESFDFGWLASNKGGLDDTYRVFKDDAGYFDPIEVDGYPGVFHSATDNRPRGHCNLVVGIRDELTFRVGGTGDGPEICDKLREMASMAITTMKAG